MSYPADSWVEVRYPLTGERRAGAPATSLAARLGGHQCGPAECGDRLSDAELATRARGSDDVHQVCAGIHRARARPRTGGRAMTRRARTEGEPGNRRNRRPVTVSPAPT